MEKSYQKLHIERNTIQETLVIPLYARKKCTALYPSIYKDEKAVELCNRLDYDFDNLEKKSGSLVENFGSLEVAMRYKDISIEIKEYLEKHPHASVVNLGCGLDETAENCDNGRCRIFNIDMPDVIKVRNELIPAKERVKNIPCDLRDTSWFEQVKNFNGCVFFASGVFYYLKDTEVHSLVNSMAEYFRGGKLVLDTCNKTGLKFMLKAFIKKSGIDKVGAFFHVNDMYKDVQSWLRNANASKKGYMTGYQNLKHHRVNPFFRLLAKFGDTSINMQILRFDFYK